MRSDSIEIYSATGHGSELHSIYVLRPCCIHVQLTRRWCCRPASSWARVVSRLRPNVWPVNHERTETGRFDFQRRIRSDSQQVCYILKRLTSFWKSQGPSRVSFFSTSRNQRSSWNGHRSLTSQERIRLSPNIQPTFLVEIHSISQSGVDCHAMTPAILLALEPGASEDVNTFPGPLHLVMHE